MVFFRSSVSAELFIWPTLCGPRRTATRGMSNTQKKQKKNRIIHFSWIAKIQTFFSSLHRISLNKKQKMARRMFLKKHTGELIAIFFVFVISCAVFHPLTAIADVDTGPHIISEKTASLIVESIQNKTRDFGILPQAQDAEARKIFTIPITAYSSTVDQCDDDPFITATGEYVYDGGIAANFLPIGTKVRIPELYGDKVFTVNDRMNARYYYRADIWMPTREQA